MASKSGDHVADDGLYTALVRAIDRLVERPVDGIRELMSWSSPVLAFGDPTRSRVATLGINPSNREFVDASGIELQPHLRRLQTLSSLGLESWREADAAHLRLIISSYNQYFFGNPYDRWFRKLDFVVQGTESSFYDEKAPACHLDLVPYSTSAKWSFLPRDIQRTLLETSADTLGLLMRGSAIECLILNGSSVINAFRNVCDVSLQEVERPEWTLQRNSSADVRGRGYIGSTQRIGDIVLEREVKVLGFNHNLQSSFGVTRGAVGAIRSWIGNLFTL